MEMVATLGPNQMSPQGFATLAAIRFINVVAWKGLAKVFR